MQRTVVAGCRCCCFVVVVGLLVGRLVGCRLLMLIVGWLIGWLLVGGTGRVVVGCWLVDWWVG